MSLEIIPVKNRQLLKLFLNCTKIINPQQLDDPYLGNRLNPRLNPWFKFGSVAMYLVSDGQNVLGRIAGFVDHRSEKNIGYFGLFETINDSNSCRLLLQAVEKWLIAQQKSEIIGPITFNSNYHVGLLLERYEKESHQHLTFHPAYYSELLADLGYDKEIDYLAYRWSTSQPLPIVLEEAARRAARNNDLVICRLTDFPFPKQVELFSSLHRLTMGKLWGFIEFSKEEAQDVVHTTVNLNDQDLLLIALCEGQPAAYCLTFRNDNISNSARLAVLGVIPEFRRRGIDATLMLETVNRLQEKAIEFLELSYIAEDNRSVNRLVETAAAKPISRYRVFRKAL